MKTLLRIFTILAVAFMTLAAPASALADTPDALANYTISIAPQTDGTLLITYDLTNYCTYSDWPGNYPYLQIGVPNGNFDIKESSGSIPLREPEKVTSGGYFVQMNMDPGSLPRNGDCFNLHFVILQRDMVHTDPQNGNITFEFIPAGWSFAIEVKTLTIKWANPSDASLLKVIQPDPTSKDDANMIWTWNNPGMDGNQMFSGSTLKLAYDKSAFTLPAPPPVQQQESGNSGSSGGGLGLDGGCLTLIVIGVILLIVIIIVVSIVENGGGDDYYGGGGGGSSGGGGGIYIPPSSSSSSHHSSGGLGSSGLGGISHGGGFGGSSGRSSGCACAGCACACACAGGGKVGCTWKGFMVKCMTRVIATLTGDNKPDSK